MTPTDVPARRPAYIEEFLQRRPEHLREFYAAIIDELMPRYKISTSGIAHRLAAGHQALPFCSLFRVKARVEDPKTQHWSRVVEILNPKGELVECTIPEGHFTGKPRDAIMALSNYGLQVYNEHQIRTIIEIARNWDVQPEAYQTLIDRVGWTEDHDAFVLTDGRVITRKGTSTQYRFSGTPQGKETGTLALWRDHIATLAVGNPNLEFGISLGLSTALLTFTELNTTIYHLYGKTTKGKTRALRAALTVWPKIGKKEKTWAGTINGLEAEIAKSHSILLGLDELRSDATPDLHAVVYRFGNGIGKARRKKEGGAEDRDEWCSAVISTGEYSFSDALGKLGPTPTGGQSVRMLDIPVIGEYGVFDNLHSSERSDDFVHRLDKAIRKSWGTAGAAFIEQLIELDVETLEEKISSDIQRYERALQTHLGVVAGEEKWDEVCRVLQSFALVATAGEWASGWGLTGWETGAAYNAVQTIAERWLNDRGRLPFEQNQILQKVRKYLTIHEHRFVHLSDAGGKGDHGAGGPIYHDDTFVYLLPSALSYMASELDQTKTDAILEALGAGGFLESGGEKNSLQKRLPSTVPNRPRAYRIRRDILDYEGQEDTTPKQPEEPEK